MPFTANQATLGNPNFKVVDINPEEVAKALQQYVERGSKLTGVSLDDISTGVTAEPPKGVTPNLAWLLEHGMKLFDALVWLTAGAPEEYKLRVDATIQQEDIASLHNVAKAVFYVYFFLVTQARYPASSKQANPPKVPNFLSVVMGLADPQHVYIDRLCTFNATGFDARWASSINFKSLGQETLSRFGLGVAGYRLFGPFKLYTPGKPFDEGLKDAVLFAKAVATAPPTWDIHPLTRLPSVLTSRGNLNKNLGNLILDVFSDEQIDEMVAAKVLFQRPVREPSVRNYYQWKADDDISGGHDIFT